MIWFSKIKTSRKNLAILKVSVSFPVLNNWKKSMGYEIELKIQKNPLGVVEERSENDRHSTPFFLLCVLRLFNCLYDGKIVLKFFSIKRISLVFLLLWGLYSCNVVTYQVIASKRRHKSKHHTHTYWWEKDLLTSIYYSRPCFLFVFVFKRASL